MKKDFFLLISANLISIATATFSYSQSDYLRAPYRRTANVSTGASYNITSPLEKDLRANELLGKGTRLNSLTRTVGLGYYSFRNSGMITGGSGYFYQVRSRATNGQVNLKTAHVFFNLGYCVIKTDKWMGFPYAGIGLTGMLLSVANAGEHKDIIIYRDTISAGKERKFESWGGALDFGFAFRVNTAGAKKIKGVYPIVGIDIGSSIFPSFDYWNSHSRHDTILSLSSPFLAAPYVRVTVGIGHHHKQPAQINL